MRYRRICLVYARWTPLCRWSFSLRACRAGLFLPRAGKIALHACSGAVAAGDGQDAFKFLPDGQLRNVVSGKCIGTAGTAVAGASVVLVDCHDAPRWDVLGSGQLQMNGPGALCLSQEGLTTGKADVAAHAAVSASSTANALAHGTELFFLQSGLHWDVSLPHLQARRWPLTQIRGPSGPPNLMILVTQLSLYLTSDVASSSA